MPKVQPISWRRWLASYYNSVCKHSLDAEFLSNKRFRWAPQRGATQRNPETLIGGPVWSREEFNE